MLIRVSELAKGGSTLGPFLRPVLEFPAPDKGCNVRKRGGLKRIPLSILVQFGALPSFFDKGMGGVGMVKRERIFRAVSGNLDVKSEAQRWFKYMVEYGAESTIMTSKCLFTKAHAAPICG